MGETRRLVSQAEYARHRGKSRQTINRLAKAGVLVMHGGLVDAAASDAVLDDRHVDVPPSPEPQTGTSLAQARLAKTIYEAKLKQLEYEKQRQRLVEAEVVKNRWASVLVTVKERTIAVPDKLAPELAANNDERQVREILKREMYALLNAWRSDVQHAR
jgi:hypothetical protein